jgi:hypothetical protein
MQVNHAPRTVRGACLATRQRRRYHPPHSPLAGLVGFRRQGTATEGVKESVRGEQLSQGAFRGGRRVGVAWQSAGLAGSVVATATRLIGVGVAVA